MLTVVITTILIVMANMIIIITMTAVACIIVDLRTTSGAEFA